MTNNAPWYYRIGVPTAVLAAAMGVACSQDTPRGDVEAIVGQEVAEQLPEAIDLGRLIKKAPTRTYITSHPGGGAVMDIYERAVYGGGSSLHGRFVDRPPFGDEGEEDEVEIMYFDLPIGERESFSALFRDRGLDGFAPELHHNEIAIVAEGEGGEGFSHVQTIPSDQVERVNNVYREWVDGTSSAFRTGDIRGLKTFRRTQHR